MEKRNWCIFVGFLVLCAVFATDGGKIRIVSSRHHNDHSRTKRSLMTSERMPHELELRVDIDDSQSVDLDLTRNDHVRSTLPVVLGDAGKIKAWQSSNQENFAVYTDSLNSAAMFVKTNYKNESNGGGTEHEFMGVFKKDDNIFTVVPPDGPFAPTHISEGGSHGNRRKRSSDYDSEEYVIKPVSRKDLTYEYDTVHRVSERDIFREEMLDTDPLFSDQEFKNYGVESLVVVDYTLYKRYYDLSQSDSADGKRDDAINWIRYYYSHIVNGVDLRFSSVREADFGIYVRLVGFYIPLTSADSPWTEGEGIRDVDEKTGKVFTHAYRALNTFEGWLADFQEELPYFDQATLFVGDKLFGGYSNDGIRRNIAGVAEIEGVCTYYRAAISQENGQYASIQTTAHEIGHNLGALHDDSQNSCKRTSQYIMAPVPTDLNDENFYNPYKFSPCSVQEFREHMHSLNVRNMNCMVNPASHFNQTEFDILLRKRPGQMFSLDQQCVNLFGHGAFYCGGMVNDEQMCERIMCYDPYQEKCWRGPEQRAATGTTCGNHKWCSRGKCVFDIDAPAAKDHCLTGDFLGKFPEGNTCIGKLNDFLGECYTDYIQKPCCAICDLLKDRTNPECAWGDRTPWCSVYIQSDCYDDRVANDDCCNTCEQYHTGIEGCEYGDRASWCAKDVQSHPGLCYTSEHTCCVACMDYKTGRKGCEYGDQTSWCVDYKHRPWSCYQSSIGRLCCDTCDLARLSFGIPDAPDCEFGDHTDVCTPSLCSDPDNWRRCCYTCRHEAAYGSPLPTTTAATRISTATTTSSQTSSPTSTTQTPVHSTSTSPRTTIPTESTTNRQTTIRRTSTTESTTPNRQSTRTPNNTPTSTTLKPSSVRSSSPHTTTSSPTTEKPPVCLDRATWCKDMPKSYCYSNDHICCVACAPVYNDIPGCEYGDHFTWCVRATRKECTLTSYQLDCCETCAGYWPAIPTETPPPPPTTTTTTTTTERPTTSAEASCTDVSVLCPFTVSRCYESQYRDLCCETCSQNHQDVEGCEYGDHYEWCEQKAVTTPSFCHDPLAAIGCCSTCTKQPKGPSTTQLVTTKIETPSTTTTTATTTTTTTTTTTSPTTERTTTPKRTQKPDFSLIAPICHGDNFDFCRHEVRGSYCYELFYVTNCCESCNAFWTNIEGCEYGDRFGWCQHINSDFCNLEVNRADCCLTCSGFESSEHPSFQPPVVSSGPPTNQSRLPSTTVGVATEDEGCVDAALWCEEMPISDCYVSADVCCSRCQEAVSSLGGCEYGNHVTWCKKALRTPKDCQREDILTNCCVDCIAFGFSLPEVSVEVDEGTVVEVETSEEELLEKHKVLLESARRQLNLFCQKYTDVCCQGFGIQGSRNQSTGSATPIILSSKDISVAAGFPTEESEQLALIKLLVQLEWEVVARRCGQSGERPRRRRHRRDDQDTQREMVFMDKLLLHDILARAKDEIQKDTNLRIRNIDLPRENNPETYPIATPHPAQRPWLWPTAGCLGVVLVGIVIILGVKRAKKRIPNKSKVSPSDDSIRKAKVVPTVYHSNSFVRKHGSNAMFSTGESLQTSSLPYWSSQVLPKSGTDLESCAEEHALPSSGDPNVTSDSAMCEEESSMFATIPLA